MRGRSDSQKAFVCCSSSCHRLRNGKYKTQQTAKTITHASASLRLNVIMDSPNDRDEARRAERTEHATQAESRRRLQHACSPQVSSRLGPQRNLSKPGVSKVRDALHIVLPNPILLAAVVNPAKSLRSSLRRR